MNTPVMTQVKGSGISREAVTNSRLLDLVLRNMETPKNKKAFVRVSSTAIAQMAKEIEDIEYIIATTASSQLRQKVQVKLDMLKTRFENYQNQTEQS